ncbi:MAG: hypothetical protein HC819_00580 [Cyclobacteriaceae bacterium]|nr:hypothetical protein [Cyclobacteriaceae bacterium]
MKTILSVVVLMLAVPCIGSNFKDPSPTALFVETEALVFVLQMDMAKVLNDKSKDPEYNTAQLIQKMPNNKIQSFNIKIKARGRTRRIQEICEFPPLKINFEKESTNNTIFSGQDKIKMVTHCQAMETYQNFTNLEYLIYKAYNQLTTHSYRVRLVEVTYQDTKQNYPDIVKTGFLIEDDDEMASRISGEISTKKYGALIVATKSP